MNPFENPLSPRARKLTAVLAGHHEARPLPFDARDLRGLSAKLLELHHEQIYRSAVENLNRVDEELSLVTRDTPGPVVDALRGQEIAGTNSVIFHELYFANLGGDGRVCGAIEVAISETFGGYVRFEELFRATGLSRTGGTGWTTLDYSLRFDRLEIHRSAGDSESVAFGIPILVLDMYEHAYRSDFDAAADKYVDAFLHNVRWEEVDIRYRQAKRAADAFAEGKGK